MEKLFSIEWYRRDNPANKWTDEILARDAVEAVAKLKALHPGALVSLISRAK